MTTTRRKTRSIIATAASCSIIVMAAIGGGCVRAFVVGPTQQRHGTLLRPIATISKHHGFNVLRSSRVNATDDVTTAPTASNNDHADHDDALLAQVSCEQLVELCQQLKLGTNGDKDELLYRLRQHAARQASRERERLLARKTTVEEGADASNAKARYEIITGEANEDDDDEDSFFYFSVPESFQQNSKADCETSVATSSINLTIQETSYITGGHVTAPPPPPPNANGERVVTVYSTTDQNDLTGVAAAQPGQVSDSLLRTTAQSTPQAWDDPSHKKSAQDAQLQQAKQVVTNLVATLLAHTGLPAFMDDDDDDDDTLSTHTFRPEHFTGFSPAQVSALALQQASWALRAQRGQVLDEVLRQFELQAIGQDGRHADNVSKGGGHYREVCKVRAFLQGYQRSETQRIARATTAVLLDKLILEGVSGLDLLLAGMARTSADHDGNGYELNDALLTFLNDAIGQQQHKVERLQRLEHTATSTEQYHDHVEQLWNVTNGEDGKVVESIDPNDARVQAVLQEEALRETTAALSWSNSTIPATAPEQLLLLLTMLRSRLQAEAQFAPDEKGRNLRLLAYTLRVNTDKERQDLMLKILGTSLDRLDSFIELVASSIEYGESTSHQLQPVTGRQPLNVPALRHILRLATDFRRSQGQRAAGLRP